MERKPSPTPGWMTTTLRLAAVYNVAWGGLTILYPNWLFDLTALEPPRYPFIWQCVGMIVGVYGLGYWIAATNPARHWPIILVGLLGKLFGPAGYATGLIAGGLGLSFIPPVPAEFGVTLITNDLVWWVPFMLILLHAFRANTGGAAADALAPRDTMQRMTTSHGDTLLDRSHRSPVLLVFLRHAGCTFCREALRDIRAQLEDIRAGRAEPVFVHMSPPDDFDRFLAQNGFNGAAHISDPGRTLYRSFELRRATLGQVFGPKVWLRGIAAVLRGNRIGALAGDGFQMPGVFLIEAGDIKRAFRHRTAADRPDYAALACPLPSSA